MLNSSKNKHTVGPWYLPGTNPLLNLSVKATLLCVLLVFARSFSSLAQTDTWVQKSDFGYNAVNVPELTPRSGAVGFSIGNKGYLGTGGSYLKDFLEYDPAGETWAQRADFGGGGRQHAVGFSIGSKGYLGTGVGSNGYLLNDFWEYDTATGAWSQKANFGGGYRFYAVGFSIGSKGYLGTGNSTKDFWEYDPAANTWTRKADFGGAARNFAVGFSIGSKGYLGTGVIYTETEDIYYNDFWEYDPGTDTWTQKADFGGTARGQAVGFSIGSKGYLGTGYNFYAGGYYKDFWEYDPVSDTWTQKADFGGTARRESVGFSIGNEGYLGTGYDGITPYNKDFWEYNPTTNTWTEKKTDFKLMSRLGAVGFNIGSKGYLGLGISSMSFKDFWEYDPITNTWTQRADFDGSRHLFAVGFSIGSKGYVGTGDDAGGAKEFWEYDPAANKWTQKADFGGTARGQCVGFSIGNKGYIGTGGYTKDFWEYDPTIDVWTRKADFGGTVRTAATGFSIGDKGYIGCGYDDWDGPRNDFWEYNPGTDTWTQKADFGGPVRLFAAGFSINGKGYIGTGEGDWNGASYKDFWEYDPSANTWTQKADFGAKERSMAVGFSIGNKGYIGTGSTQGYNAAWCTKDFWEYIPDTKIPVITAVTDINSSQAYVHWHPYADAVSYVVRRYRSGTSDYGDYLPVTDTFRKVNNMSANSLYVVQVKAYFNNGASTDWSAPYSFTTANTCAVPLKPRVSLITDTSARLNWSLPVLAATNFRIRYKESGATEWSVKSKKGTETKYNLKGLKPSTLYNWQIRSMCTDDITEWVTGPDFTTAAASFATVSTNAAVNEIAAAKNGLLISPNPSKGNFTVQMQLPAKAASTTLALYNNFGQLVWQQNLGNISGAVQRTISLENKLSAGLYTITIQRSDIKLNQKILINK